jgi:hypothetical protein
MVTSSGKSDPVVLRISAADVVEALVRGLRDFQALPFFGLLFGALYAAGGILIVLSVTAFGMVYLPIRSPRALR